MDIGLYIYKIIYAVLILFAVFLYYKKDWPAVGKRIVYCSLAFLILFFIIAFRNPYMGADLPGYIKGFETIHNWDWDLVTHESYQNYEHLYMILNKLIGEIKFDFQLLLAVCAFLSIFPASYYITRYSRLPSLSFIIYMGLPLFTLMFSGLRQVIAIGFCFWALIFAREKKLVPFLLAVIVAYFFHQSAIVFLIVYPLYYIKLGKQLRIATIVVIPFIYVFRMKIFVFFCSLFGKSPRVDNNGSMGLFILFVMIYIVCSLLCHTDDLEQNALLNIFYIACCCQAMAGLNNLIIRVGYYFMIGLICLIPSIIEKSDVRDGKTFIMLTGEESKGVVIFAFFALFTLFGYRLLTGTSWAMAYPYYFCWQ